MKQTRVLIVGASVSGLASAACLTKNGIEYTIIEKDSRIATPWHNHYERLHLARGICRSQVGGICPNRRCSDSDEASANELGTTSQTRTVASTSKMPAGVCEAVVRMLGRICTRAGAGMRPRRFSTSEIAITARR